MLVLDTGKIGSGIIRLVLEKQGLEAGQAIWFERDSGIRISTDLVKVIEQVQQHPGR